MAIKQDNRLIAIKTPLGPDVLGLRSFSMQEQISRLFQIEAELSSENGEFDFDKVVGHSATIRLYIGQKDKRYFDGVVSRLVQVANQGGYAHYRATIVPWLWFLTRTSDCRIFQQKTVPDIIEAVFKGHGFNDYQLKLSGNYQPREYCVQYRETDFNFVSRLMEQEGIYYFFEHQDGKHTLVLADSISAHKPFPGYADVTFHELEKGAAAREVITDWTMEKEVQPVASALQDFDFKKPKTSLLASTNVTRKYGKAQFEIYDYPGEYVDHGDGQRLADVRLEELQTQYETLHGEASARGLAAGHIFKLKNHPRKDQNRDYLITGVSLHADAGEFATAGGGSGGGGEVFSCNFTAIDKTQQFRPARLTPTPIVQGPQTAFVVGKAGQEVDPDEHGRVKVQFHWDRNGKLDQNSSCWIRVSQAWAGGMERSGSVGWGDMAIPHLGDEVVVEFLEGVPDRPIITGRVYNGKNRPPMDLPTHKHVRILRDNFGNEIVMDATPGSGGLHLYSPNIVTMKMGGGGRGSGGGGGGGGVEGGGGGEGGHKMELLAGDSIEVINGSENKLIIGLKQDHVVGTRCDATVGGSLGLALGIAAEINRQQRWEHGIESNLISSHEDSIVSAKETLCLLGGAGGKKTSVINASEEGITLSVGEGKDVKDPVPGAALAAVMALIPTLHAAYTAYRGIATKGKQNEIEPWKSDVITANWKRHLVLVAAYAAAWAVCKTQIKSHAKPVDHKEPKGFLRMEGEEGVLKMHSKKEIDISSDGLIHLQGGIEKKRVHIGLTSNGQIIIHSDGNILLKATGEIILEAKGVKGPKYDTVGPQDLGSGNLHVDDSAPAAPAAPEKPEVKYKSAAGK